MIKPRDVLVMMAMLAVGVGLGIASRPDERIVSPAPRAAPSTEATTTSPETPARPTDTPKSNNTVATRSTALPATLPLPPTTLPLSNSYADLRRRAEQGDVSAACRLGKELLMCSFPTYENPREVDRTGLDPSKAKTPEERRRIEFQLDRIDRETWRIEHCAGTTRAQKGEAMRWLRAAAEGGHVPSMALYASGWPMRFTNVATQLDEAERYRDQALGMMRQLVEAGEVDGANMLVQAYGIAEAHSYPSQILTNGRSEREALTYRLLAAMASEPSATSPPSAPTDAFDRSAKSAADKGVDAATIEAARAEAERRFQQWFGGKRSSSHLGKMWSYGPKQDADINAICSDGPWLKANEHDIEGQSR